MGDLAVSVLVHGNVVDDRVVPVRRLVRLGESDDAVVAFPGADLAIVRVGRGLALRGRVLEEGEEMCISLGHVEVRLLRQLRCGQDGLGVIRQDELPRLVAIEEHAEADMIAEGP